MQRKNEEEEEDMHYTKLKSHKSNSSLGNFAQKKDKLFPLFAQCKKKNKIKHNYKELKV